MDGRIRARAPRAGLNLPNAVSAVRFPLAALFPLAGGYARIAVVVAAAASDWIDGRLARGRRQVTSLGAVLDPIADKTFMLVVLVTLGVEGALPLWALPLLLVRDIGVALGALMLAARRRTVHMPARRAGKVVTWLQFTAIGGMLIWPPTGPWLAPVVGAAGLWALVDYRLALTGDRRRAHHEATSGRG